MRCIVTGGAGFIGSNLADTLAQNHDVVIIDNLATKPSRVTTSRLEQKHRQERCFAQERSWSTEGASCASFPGADGIFHQAASTSPGH